MSFQLTGDRDTDQKLKAIKSSHGLAMLCTKTLLDHFNYNSTNPEFRHWMKHIQKNTDIWKTVILYVKTLKEYSLWQGIVPFLPHALLPQLESDLDEELLLRLLKNSNLYALSRLRVRFDTQVMENLAAQLLKSTKKPNTYLMGFAAFGDYNITSNLVKDQKMHEILFRAYNQIRLLSQDLWRYTPLFPQMAETMIIQGKINLAKQ